MTEQYNIGRTFTPINWAHWLLERYGVYEAWRSGANLIDPTCGQGAFFIALMDMFKEKEETCKNIGLERLFGVEINPDDKNIFLKSFYERFKIRFPENNFVTKDFMDYSKQERFDIAVGNPPWANFTDLPQELKNNLKQDFIKYGLVTNKKNVLLGGSRIDIAALIIQKCMQNHLTHNGLAYFYSPMSIFFNEGAHMNFRPKTGKDSNFCVAEIIRFDKTSVFENISTQYGIIALKKNTKQKNIIPLTKINNENVKDSLYCRTSADGSAWFMTKTNDKTKQLEKIKVKPHQIPRQGMNSAGLNKIFILECVSNKNENLSKTELFTNGLGETQEISTEFILPLMNGNLFGNSKANQRRFILCLHDKNGQAIDNEEINKLPYVKKYLEKHKLAMQNRKGILIQAQIAKGKYWSLFGVGSYSFSKYKIAWESMGKKKFNAVVLEGAWQGNQSLHSYIPAEAKEDAVRICDELNNKMPAYLEAFGMEGTCNWAQPGRIKRILENK